MDQNRFNPLAKFTEPISLGTAAKYIADIKSNSGLLKVFSKHQGGTLNAQVFKEWHADPNFKGVMAWFCTKGLFGNNPFLVFEKKTNEFVFPSTIAELLALEPTSDHLISANHRFGNSFNREPRAFLIGHQDSGPSTNLGEGRRFVPGYLKKFLKKDAFRNLQSVAVGYLDNGQKGEDYFGQFLNQIPDGISYIRYYFGFDSDVKLNKIRFFLVAVDQSGKNITSINKAGITQDAIILQKSWPPPPDTLDTIR
jgi:hypothetical protein